MDLTNVTYELEKVFFDKQNTYVCMSDDGMKLVLVEEWPVNYYFFNENNPVPMHAQLVAEIKSIKDNKFCLGEL